MASITEKNGSYYVVYNYTNSAGEKKQKWEKQKNLNDAKRRRTEIEYQQDRRELVVTPCITLKDLLDEYVSLYGKEKWSLATYSANVGLIENYITPIIGDEKLEKINTRFLEKYYQKLLRTPQVSRANCKKTNLGFVTTSTIRDIHKLLRSCFHQAEKWEIVGKNPVTNANVPKHRGKKREIWTAETLMYALEVCEDERLKMALQLSFACSLRLGELLGLTWDCVDITPEAIQNGRAYVYVNKEMQRVDKTTITELDGKDIIRIFPEVTKKNKTVRVLKSPKTESSIRKVFLPRTVAEMLVEWKKGQDKLMEMLGDEYQDFDLVMASSYGLPIEHSVIRNSLCKLIKEHDLPPVVFHSLRHTSITYKLKLNGGNIKAVQGDSGHAQIKMVTDVYSHIIDEDRRINAELFENAFYEKRIADPVVTQELKETNAKNATRSIETTDTIDPDLMKKVLENPEMLRLLTQLAKNIAN